MSNPAGRNRQWKANKNKKFRVIRCDSCCVKLHELYKLVLRATAMMRPLIDIESKQGPRKCKTNLDYRRKQRKMKPRVKKDDSGTEIIGSTTMSRVRGGSCQEKRHLQGRL